MARRSEHEQIRLPGACYNDQRWPGSRKPTQELKRFLKRASIHRFFGMKRRGDYGRISVCRIGRRDDDSGSPASRWVAGERPFTYTRDQVIGEIDGTTIGIASTTRIWGGSVVGIRSGMTRGQEYMNMPAVHP